MTLFTDLCGNSQSTLESFTAKGRGARDSLADAQGRLGSVISTDLQVERRPQLTLCELTSRSGAVGCAARAPPPTGPSGGHRQGDDVACLP